MKHRREAWRVLAEDRSARARKLLERHCVRGRFTAPKSACSHIARSSLLQNRCFLIIDREQNREWKVRSAGWARRARIGDCARKAGAEFLINVDLVDVDLAKRSVEFESPNIRRTFRPKFTKEFAPTASRFRRLQFALRFARSTSTRSTLIRKFRPGFARAVLHSRATAPSADRTFHSPSCSRSNDKETRF